jgi:hypothetical protein
MPHCGNVQTGWRIEEATDTKPASPADQTGAPMRKISLIALFTITMATLTIAASALPVDAPMNRIASLG